MRTGGYYQASMQDERNVPTRENGPFRHACSSCVAHPTRHLVTGNVLCPLTLVEFGDPMRKSPALKNWISGCAHQRKLFLLILGQLLLQTPQPHIGSLIAREIRVRRFHPKPYPDYDRAGLRTGKCMICTVKYKHIRHLFKYWVSRSQPDGKRWDFYNFPPFLSRESKKAWYLGSSVVRKIGFPIKFMRGWKNDFNGPARY